MTKWTADHWLNLALFIVGTLAESLVAFSGGWSEVGKLLTPAAAAGFVLQLIAFVRAMYTQKPREAYGERATDPK